MRSALSCRPPRRSLAQAPVRWRTDSGVAVAKPADVPETTTLTGSTVTITSGHSAAVPAAAPPRVLPWLALGTVYLVWGSTYLAIRIGVQTVPPLAFAGFRFLLAGLLLYPLARARSRTPSPTFRQWRAAAVIGVLLVVGGNGLVTWAEQTVASGIAALLVATVPLWMVVIDRMSGGERLRLSVVVGLVLGLIGVVVLVGPPDGGRSDLMGILGVLLAAVFWAAGSIRSRRGAPTHGPLEGTAMQMLCGGGLLLVLGGAGGEFARLDLQSIDTAAWASFVWLVLFGSIVAYSSYIYALTHLPTSTVATYAYVNPGVAVLLGWLVLDEQLDVRTTVGGIVIAVAVAVILWARPRRATPPADQ